MKPIMTTTIKKKDVTLELFQRDWVFSIKFKTERWTTLSDMKFSYMFHNEPWDVIDALNKYMWIIASIILDDKKFFDQVWWYEHIREKMQKIFLLH